jgi:hypothetical protein
MKSSFSLFLTTFSGALLLAFAVPACDLEDDSEFRAIRVVDEEDPPCECVCIEDLEDDYYEEEDEGRSSDPPGKGGGKGKGKGPK